MAKGRAILALFVAAWLLAGFLAISQPASASHVPNWTYTAKDFTKRADPISLIVYSSLSTASQALLNAGWHKTTCGYTEYVYYNGQWRAQNLMLEKDQQGWCGILGTRKHVRLWQLETNVVAMAAHLDHTHSRGHQVHDYEGIEGSVANDFRLTSYQAWQVVEDDHLLDNYVNYLHDGLVVFNDGNATQVYLKQTTSIGVAGDLGGVPIGTDRVVRIPLALRTPAWLT